MKLREFLDEFIPLAMDITAREMAELDSGTKEQERRVLSSFYNQPRFSALLDNLETRENPKELLENSAFVIGNSGMGSQIPVSLAPGKVNPAGGLQLLAAVYFQNLVNYCLVRGPQMTLQSDLTVITEYAKNLSVRKSGGLNEQEESQIRAYLTGSLIDMDSVMDYLKNSAVSKEINTGQYL